MSETVVPPKESDLVKRIRADFEQFESVYLPNRNIGGHPQFLFCNRMWRLFDVVATHIEEASADDSYPRT